MNFYKQAAEILDRLAQREGTIKALTLADDVKDKRRMYALVCETLKHKDTISTVIEKSNILHLEKKLTHSLALVLVHDLLFTPRGVQLSNGPLKQTVLRHKTRLSSELTRIKIKSGAKTVEDLVPASVKEAVSIPRYSRVNTIKISVDEALRKLKKEGYTVCEPTQELLNLKKRTVRCDVHLPDILVFPPGTDLHDHPMYVSGELILQDKASCFPAHVLFADPKLADPSFKMPDVIDGCAAPGNKTSHAAARMSNKGKIWAFDLDARRLGTLKNMTQKAGCKIIEPRHGSFLDTKPDSPEFSNVGYFILDPSCSGSGIVSRLDHLIDENGIDEESAEDLEARLRNLADFQLKIVLHAMQFSAASRIVYSTCSVHFQENEGVVQRVLESPIAEGWQLAPRSEVLPTWVTRGEVHPGGLSADLAERVVRARPAKDHTNGFFVACFVKRGEETVVDPSVEQIVLVPKRNKSNKKKRKKQKKKAGVNATPVETPEGIVDSELELDVSQENAPTQSHKKRRKD